MLKLIKNKSPQEIDQIQKEIIKNQNKFYNSIELSFKPFINFLEKNNIERVWVDFIASRQDLYKKKYDKWIDLYYPWALVFTGRLCDTSAIEKPERGNYAIDEICPRTCFKYDIFYKIKTIWYNLIQRWNSAFRSEIEIERLDINFIYNKNNRIVYAPFITV